MPRTSKRTVNTHTERDKQLMARGKTAKAKAATKREADLLDTTVGSGGTDTTPSATAPAPTAAAPTRSQAEYRSLVKQLRLKTAMIEHWNDTERKAGPFHTDNWKALHAQAQREIAETDKRNIERRMAEVLKDDPDADK